MDLLQGKSGDRGWDEARCEGAICLAGTMEGAVGGSYPQQLIDWFAEILLLSRLDKETEVATLIVAE